MARKFKFDAIREERKAMGMNQMTYWPRYGLTQSAGSRYETGRSIHLPARVLMQLVHEGTVTEEQLAAALKKVK